jgi:hypothetical protein
VISKLRRPSMRKAVSKSSGSLNAAVTLSGIFIFEQARRPTARGRWNVSMRDRISEHGLFNFGKS